MTAHRVVTDHDELENNGIVKHSQLDTYVTGSAFLLVSGSGPMPGSSRNLRAGTGISLNDGGPGKDLVINSSLASTPTRVGQVLFAVTADKFSVALPIVSNAGWLVNNSGLLLVSSSI